MDILATVLSGAIQVSSLSVGETPNIKRATSYDGVARNVERFYDDKNHNVRLNGTVAVNRDRVIRFGVDTGHQSAKYRETPTINLGVTQRHNIERFKGHSITWSLDSAAGGKVKHKPCYDEFNRKYYCGDLTAWNDFNPERIEHETKASINYSIRW